MEITALWRFGRGRKLLGTVERHNSWAAEQTRPGMNTVWGDENPWVIPMGMALLIFGIVNLPKRFWGLGASCRDSGQVAGCDKNQGPQRT